MKTWFRKSVAVGVLASGLLISTGATAQADSGVITTGTASGNGILSGNVVQIPVTVVAALQLCNNSVLAVSLANTGVCSQGNVGVANTP